MTIVRNPRRAATLAGILGRRQREPGEFACERLENARVCALLPVPAGGFQQVLLVVVEVECRPGRVHELRHGHGEGSQVGAERVDACPADAAGRRHDRIRERRAGVADGIRHRLGALEPLAPARLAEEPGEARTYVGGVVRGDVRHQRCALLRPGGRSRAARDRNHDDPHVVELAQGVELRPRAHCEPVAGCGRRERSQEQERVSTGCLHLMLLVTQPSPDGTFTICYFGWTDEEGLGVGSRRSGGRRAAGLEPPRAREAHGGGRVCSACDHLVPARFAGSGRDVQGQEAQAPQAGLPEPDGAEPDLAQPDRAEPDLAEPDAPEPDEAAGDDKKHKGKKKPPPKHKQPKHHKRKKKRGPSQPASDEPTTRPHRRDADRQERGERP